MRRASGARCRTMFSLTYLYRDDIAQIMEMLKSHCSTVKLIIGGNELDDASEMENLNEPYYNWCVIKAGNTSENSDTIIGPDIELEISVLGIILTLAGDNKDALIDVKQQIGEIFKKRTGDIPKASTTYIYIGIFNLFMMLFFGSLLYIRNNNPLTLIGLLLLSLVFVGLPFLSARFPTRKGGVYTRESTDHT